MKGIEDVKVFKRGLFAIVLLLVVSLIYLQKNCSTIEKYLSRTFSNVTIHKIDYSKNLVLFSEGNAEGRQYILARFRNFKGYYFDLYDEEGWTYDGSYLLLVSYKHGIGNVIWGTFNNNDRIERIELEYKDAKSKAIYPQKITIKNNTYFEYLPKELINENFLNGLWRYNIKTYDEKDKLIFEDENKHFYYERIQNYF